MSLSSPPARASRSSRHGRGHRRTGSGGSQSSFASLGTHGTHQTHGTFQSHQHAGAGGAPHFMKSTVASVHQVHGASPRAGSTRGGGSGGRNSEEHRVDDAPIQDFIDKVESLHPSEEWRGRSTAFEALVATVPESAEQERSHPTHQPGCAPWYRSPAALRRLALPLRELLGDARSTVARSVTEQLARLMEKIAALTAPESASAPPEGNARLAAQLEQKGPQSDAGRYLMKDLLPSLLALHGQTVNVIRGYALQTVLRIIPCSRFKSGLPILLERLRRDKSRDVREACARYLRAVLAHWSEAPSSSATGGAYLTRDIAVHIGNALARALTDPSQCVRMEARRGFEDFRLVYPEVWERVVHREDGPLSRDLKLKKSVVNAAVRADAERSLAGEALPSSRAAAAGATAGVGTRAQEHQDDDDARSVGSHASAHSYASAASSRASGIPSGVGGGAGGMQKRGRGGQQSKRGLGGMRSPTGRSVSSMGSTSRMDREAGAFPPKSPATRPSRISENGTGDSSSRAGGASSSSQPFADVMKSPDPSDRRDSALFDRRGGNANNAGKKKTRSSRSVIPQQRQLRGTLDSLDGATSAMQGLSLSNVGATGKLGEPDVMRYRAAVSIQAAVRGMTTRSKVMEAISSGKDVSTIFQHHRRSNSYKSRRPGDLSTANGAAAAAPGGGGKELSLELEMLRNAKAALKLGMTAQQMADRRQTLGDGDSADVPPPVPPSPAESEARALALSCASPAMGEGLHKQVTTPRESSRRGSFGWQGGSTPGQGKTPGTGNRNPASAAAGGGGKQRSFDFDQLPPPPPSGGSRASALGRGSPMLAQTPDSAGTGRTSAGTDTVGTISPEAAMELRAATVEKLQTLRKARSRTANPRGRKSSVMLQERLKRGALASPMPPPSNSKSRPDPPGGLGAVQEEHVAVGEEILAAHRSSMDAMMANLSLEMDVLRDFEGALHRRREARENGDTNGADSQGPSDEDVLGYFEAVALCLDERSAIGERLRVEMDRIGRGDNNEEEI